MYGPPLALNEIVRLPSQMAYAGAIWFVSLNVCSRAESSQSEILAGWLQWVGYRQSTTDSSRAISGQSDPMRNFLGSGRSRADAPLLWIRSREGNGSHR